MSVENKGNEIPVHVERMGRLLLELDTTKPTYINEVRKDVDSFYNLFADALPNSIVAYYETHLGNKAVDSKMVQWALDSGILQVDKVGTYIPGPNSRVHRRNILNIMSSHEKAKEEKIA